MSGSSDRLRVLCPEFTSAVDYPDATLDTFLTLAASLHTASVFGAVYGDAMAYYAAHLLKMATTEDALSSATGGVTAGGVTAVKAGDLSVSFGGVSVTLSGGSVMPDQLLAQTTYGRLYLTIRNTRYVRAPTVVTP